MKDKKKILFIHHGKGIGGAPISMRNVVLEVIEQLEVEIVILFMFNSSAVTLFKEIECRKIILNQPYFYFNHTSRSPKWYRIDWHILMLCSWFVTAFYIAPKYLKKIKPDLVYLNSSVLTDWSFASKKNYLENIVHVREAINKGTYGLRHALLSKLLNSYPSLVIFISKENESRITIECKDSALIYDDIGKEYENYNLRNTSFSKPLKPLKIGYLGGMSRIKGIDIISYLNNLELPLLEFYLAGNITKAKFKRKFGLVCDSVRFIGLIEDVVDFIEKIDILLCPITTTHFCRPVLEAAALGKPSILPAIEGMTEMIEHNVTGYLYDPDDISSLPRILQTVQMNKSLLQELGKNARRKYNLEFSRIENNKKLISLFRSLLSNSHK